MTAAITSVPQGAQRSSKRDRWFYVIAGVVMLLCTAGGFRRFYLHGRAPWGDMTAQILPLVVAHGLAMTTWVLVFLIQSALIQSGRRKLHLVLGPLGVVLAGAIVILGSAVAFLSVRFSPQIYTDLGGPRAFLATMLVEMLLFGTLVGIGWAFRRKPDIHRPMMLLATVVIQSGAFGRLPYIEKLTVYPPLYVWWPVLLFGALLFVLQWGMNRVPNRWYLMGYAGIVTASLLSFVVGTTAVWNRMVGSFIP